MHVPLLLNMIYLSLSRFHTHIYIYIRTHKAQQARASTVSAIAGEPCTAYTPVPLIL